MTTEQALPEGSGPGYDKHPGHRVQTSPFRGRVAVSIGGQQIADSTHAILLTESDYEPVYYIPKSDVNFSLLTSADNDSYCPFKGKATYWRAKDGGNPIAWAYDRPYREVAEIEGHLAFYKDRTVQTVTQEK